MYTCIGLFSFEVVVIRLLQNSIHTESDSDLEFQFSKAMHPVFAVEGILKLSFF